jgi:hypothetical protein
VQSPSDHRRGDLVCKKRNIQPATLQQCQKTRSRSLSRASAKQRKRSVPVWFMSSSICHTYLVVGALDAREFLYVLVIIPQPSELDAPNSGADAEVSRTPRCASKERSYRAMDASVAHKSLSSANSLSECSNAWIASTPGESFGRAGSCLQRVLNFRLCVLLVGAIDEEPSFSAPDSIHKKRSPPGYRSVTNSMRTLYENWKVGRSRRALQGTTNPKVGLEGDPVHHR